jgi:hypothetical protein
MRRLALLAVLALALFAAPAAGSQGDGGVPAGFDGGDSGGTPADWDGESSDSSTQADVGTTGSESSAASGAGAVTTGSGGALAASGGGPTATAAQEPTPQPEGPGTQQPGDPGTQPAPGETPSVPGAEATAGQAPVGGTGGSLPVTGVEVLQLTLLGIALLLVGARLRVLALQRRRGRATPSWREAERAYEEDFAAPITARRTTAPRAERRVERDEWSFPDPDEPAPTGLLPSTASARRRARALAAERD